MTGRAGSAWEVQDWRESTSDLLALKVSASPQVDLPPGDGRSGGEGPSGRSTSMISLVDLLENHVAQVVRGHREVRTFYKGFVVVCSFLWQDMTYAIALQSKFRSSPHAQGNLVHALQSCTCRPHILQTKALALQVDQEGHRARKWWH